MWHRNVRSTLPKSSWNWCLAREKKLRQWTWRIINLKKSFPCALPQDRYVSRVNDRAWNPDDSSSFRSVFHPVGEDMMCVSIHPEKNACNGASINNVWIIYVIMDGDAFSSSNLNALQYRQFRWLTWKHRNKNHFCRSLSTRQARKGMRPWHWKHNSITKSWDESSKSFTALYKEVSIIPELKARVFP